MNAVHEMLLQSWSPTPGKLDSEVVRVFPAVPDAWRDVEFNDLRAEGGYRVSATRLPRFGDPTPGRYRARQGRGEPRGHLAAAQQL